jgi:hypothetical protein
MKDRIEIFFTVILLAGLSFLGYLVITTKCVLSGRSLPQSCTDYPLYIKVMFANVIILGAWIVYKAFKKRK